MLDPETDFFIFLKTLIFSFRPKFTFSVTKFKIHPVEYAHMDHTDHFGFRSHFISIWKTFTQTHVLAKVTFWDYREHELTQWRYLFKSSPMLGSTPQGLLFLKHEHFWNFRTCPFWRSCMFAHIWSESWPIHADVLRRLLGKALGFRLLKCISWKTFNLDNYGAILFTNPDNYNNPRLGLFKSRQGSGTLLATQSQPPLAILKVCTT